MLRTKRKPATSGEILVEEFMKPIGLTQGALAEAMGVQRKHVNELCNDRRNVTAATALILARVFGNSPEFWLNVQRRKRSMGGDAFADRAQTHRTRATSDISGVSPLGHRRGYLAASINSISFRSSVFTRALSEIPRSEARSAR